MPTSLTATKIKDTYGQVLHVDGGVNSTPKLVYDGDGTATALKVSTTDVQVNNSPVLTDVDIGSTVQAYDADLTAWSGKTAPTGTVVGTSDSQALSNKSFGDNPTLSAGTANGVAYLNGSKVLTTGSALTFDGTTLTAGGFAGPLTGNVTGNVSGNAGTVTNGVYTVGDQTIGGTKTFSVNPILNAGTANQLQFLNGSKQLVGDADLTFDGTTLTAAGFAGPLTGNVTGNVSGNAGTVTNGVYTVGDQTIGGTKTFSVNPILNAGTANSIPYLNGSKVLTTGSALTFDGSIIDTNVSGSTALRLTSSTAQAYISLTSATAGSAPFVGFNNGTGALGSIAAISGGGLSFASGNTERMRLDSSGNLGLGVTPSAWGGSYKGFQIGQGGLMSRTGGSDVYLLGNNYYDGTNFRYINASYASRYQQDAGAHAWYTAPSGTAGNAISFTQAMTLDASGNLLVGTTSFATPGLAVNPAGYIFLGNSNALSGFNFLTFQRNGSTIGFIQQNGTTAVSYNTSSDYRLKENIQPMQNALGVVAQLNPVRYTWKADGSDGQGFIAHELQAVVPDCVTGEKDAVDAEGKPVYQGIDTSFLVATLTKAIQELKAELDATKAEVAALKGGN